MYLARIYFNLILRFLSIGLVFLVLALIFSVIDSPKAGAVAGINRTINFQGKLVNNPAKTNVSNTSYTVVFTIYDRASGGTALWSETQNVTTADGIFRVNLGSVTPIPSNFNFNWDGLYLGVKVNADSEMTPRVQLAAVPFAFNAEKVSGLTVQDSTGAASTSGTLRIANNKIINLGADNLTFTTSGDTSVTLPTTGTLSTLAGSEIFTNKTIGSTGLTFSGASTDITTATDEDLTITPDGSGDLIVDLTSTGEFYIRDAGNNFAQFLADGTITFGKSASGGTINLGVGTGADVINFGSNNTSGDTLVIGNNNSSTTLSLTGGNDWSIDTAGAAVLTSISGITSLTGAGLVDCDSATSKLLWNDSAGTFSCGTDMGSNLQTIGLNDTNTENLTTTNSRILDNGVNEYLGITPFDTSSKILINVTIRVDSDNTDSEVDVFTIYRTTDGNTPVCDSSTLVGSAMEIETTNIDDDGWVAGNFVDSPNTTNEVRYTVCGDSTGGTASNDTNQITLTLTEIGSSSAGGGSGNVSVRETDSSPSVASASTIEFGPSSSSSDEFVVTDEGSGVARIRIGSQVGLLNEAEIVTGGWTFNTTATTFTTGIVANGGIDTASNTNLSLAANGNGHVVIASDFNSGVKIGSSGNVPAPLSVSGGIGSNAAFILDQLNSGDIFAASSSGTTRFVIDNSGNLGVTGSVNLTTGNIDFSGAGSLILNGGTISDDSDEVDINDDLAVNGNISFTGTTGLTLTGSGADITFTNLEQISNDTNGTFTLGRNDTGTVTLNARDDDSIAALSILSGGASTLTLDTGGAATLNIGNSNSNDIVIGNSNSSTNITFTKGASGNITLTGFNCSTFTNGGTLTANSSGFIECQNDDGGAATATYWDSSDGTIYPNNTTYDLLIGGSATASAKFGFINVSNGGIPTATISAISGNAISLDANGNITTTKRQRLTLGGGDSGEVYTASLLRIDSTLGVRGGGLSDCDNPTTAKLLWDDATNRFSCGTDQGGGGGSSVTVRETDSAPAVSAVAVIEFGPASTSSDEFIVTDEGTNIARIRIGNQVGMLNQGETVSGGWTFNTTDTAFTTGILANGGINTATDTDLVLASNGSGNTILSTDFDSGVYIGSSGNTPALLSISGGIGNNAALIVNQLNSGNIFTASASGVTVFSLDSSGNFLLSGGAISDSSDGVDINDDLDISGNLNLTSGNILLTGGTISDSSDEVDINDDLAIAGSTGLIFSSTGGVNLAGGTISDSSGDVDINDNLTVSGTTGLTLSGSGADLIFANGESFTNDTNNTLTLKRNDAGTITLNAADDDAIAALTINSGGAAVLTLDTGGSAALSIGETNASSVTIGNTANGFGVTINTGTGTLNLGDVATTKAIEIGGVDSDGGDTIRIATNATSADAINIGNANSSTTMALTGGDDWSISSAGTATFTKFAGAGLSGDCDSVNSKLLWDTTNQTFSCGTDDGVDSVTVESFTASDTWTKTDYVGLTFTQVITTGGGGGGGGADSPDTTNEIVAGGGGAGGTAIEIIAAASLGTTETVTVDTTGGAGGNGSGSNGTAGGNSSFGSHNSATGGNGGTGVTTNATGCAGGVGAGGLGQGATGGDINLTGGDGTQGFCNATALNGGDGGSSYWGGGGRGAARATAGSSAGEAGSAYGSGGGGAVSRDNTTGATGGDGTDGIIVTFNYRSSAGDLAEWYDTKDGVEAGDVVAVSSESMEYETNFGIENAAVMEKAVIGGGTAMGVVSTVPNQTLGNDIMGGSKRPRPIALAGRVPVKVTEDNGKIKAGDLLTVSRTPGVAQLSTKAGITIGRALEDSNCVENEVCKVNVMVSTSYSTGALVKVAMRNQGMDVDTLASDLDHGRYLLTELIQDKEDIVDYQNLSEVFADRIAAGLEVITPRVVTDEMLVRELKPLDSEIVITLEEDNTFRILNSSGSGAITFDSGGNGDFSGKLSALEIETPTLRVDSIHAKNIKAENIEGLSTITSRIDSLEARIATLSATKTLAVSIEYATTSSEFEEEKEKLAQEKKLIDLISQQIESSTRSSSLAASSGFESTADSIRTRGNALIEGVLNVIDSIVTNNFIANGLATFFGDAVFKARVAFEGPVEFNNDTGGVAIIRKDTEKVEVTFDKEFEEMPVLNASVTFDEKRDKDGNLESSDTLKREYFAKEYQYIIVDKSKKGFVIALNKKADSDISFTWTAIRVKDSKTVQSRLID